MTEIMVLSLLLQPPNSVRLMKYDENDVSLLEENRTTSMGRWLTLCGMPIARLNALESFPLVGCWSVCAEQWMTLGEWPTGLALFDICISFIPKWDHESRWTIGIDWRVNNGMPMHFAEKIRNLMCFSFWNGNKRLLRPHRMHRHTFSLTGA